jgi:hypothetical protein
MFQLCSVWLYMQLKLPITIRSTHKKNSTRYEAKTSLWYVLIKLVDLMSDGWPKMVFVLICCETDTIMGVGVRWKLHTLLDQRVEASRLWGLQQQRPQSRGEHALFLQLWITCVYLYTPVIYVLRITVCTEIFTLYIALKLNPWRQQFPAASYIGPNNWMSFL